MAPLVRLFCAVAALAVLLQTSSAESSGDGISGMCLCQSSILVVAHNSSNGVQLIVQDAASGNQSTLLITAHYLPMECDANFKRCNIIAFQNSDKLYIVFPVIRGLAVAVLQYEYVASSRTLQFGRNYNFSISKANEDCSPTNIFLSEPQTTDVFLTPCLHLDGESSTLHYLEFTLDIETGSLTQTDSSPSEKIYNPATLSESVYLVDQQGCSDYDNLYAIDDQFLLQCPVVNELSIIGNFMYPQSQMRKCDEYTSIENYGGNLLLIRCSTQLSVAFEPCVDEIEYFNASLRGIPYPCSSWEKVAYLQNNAITIVGDDDENGFRFSFPFDVSHGRCVDLQGKSIFIASSENGSVAVLHTATGQLSVLTQDTGLNAEFRPSLSTSGAGVVFAIPSLVKNMTKLVVVNATSKQNQIVAEVPLESSPDSFMTTVLLTDEASECQCAESELEPTAITETETYPTVGQATTEIEVQPTVSQLTTPTYTSTTDKQSTEIPSESSTVLTSPKLHIQDDLLLKLIPVYILAVGGIISVPIIICCFVWYKYSRLSKTCFKLLPRRREKATTMSCSQPQVEYGNFDLNCKAVSDSVTALEKCDVAVAGQTVMPATAYGVHAVGGQLEKRCDTEEKAVDFKNKVYTCSQSPNCTET